MVTLEMHACLKILHHDATRRDVSYFFFPFGEGNTIATEIKRVVGFGGNQWGVVRRIGGVWIDTKVTSLVIVWKRGNCYGWIVMWKDKIWREVLMGVHLFGKVLMNITVLTFYHR